MEKLINFTLDLNLPESVDTSWFILLGVGAGCFLAGALLMWIWWKHYKEPKDFEAKVIDIANALASHLIKKG